MKPFLSVLLICIIYSCASIRNPRSAYSYRPVPAGPDYSLQKYWAALPDMDDPSDLLPDSSLQYAGDKAAADVFFIHPTTYYKGPTWNADLNDEALNLQTDLYPIKYQASVFNGSCRVFAPRYRQAVIKAFYQNDDNSKQALALAYTDVKAAFQYYLDHYNNGRPILIAGHSQGGLMAMWLLKDYFQDEKMLNQLVAAYPIGWPVPPDSIPKIPPCRQVGQTACYASWNTVGWAYKLHDDTYDFYAGALCVNPLSWTIDEAYSAADFNLGALPRSFDHLVPEACDAQVHGPMLWVHRDKLPLAIKLKGKRLHILDYNLFWKNIRINVEQQISNYMEVH